MFWAILEHKYDSNSLLMSNVKSPIERIRDELELICNWYCLRYLSLWWLHQSQHKHDHDVFLFSSEQKQSSTFQKFPRPKQQLISTESIDKPSKSTETEPSEGAQNLIAIILSLPKRKWGDRETLKLFLGSGSLFSGTSAQITTSIWGF